ncbi:hypothetical protein KI387_035365, partial [Taxus chinensis]
NLYWQHVDYKAYPERLTNRYGGESASKLLPVDIIITTTDPFKEPALMTANTVLSVLALDYPVEKIACYVSDDGASPITFYSLVETLSFAKKWVPFCMKFNVETRAPFMYFSKQKKPSDPDFAREWLDMKGEYESLQKKISEALETGKAPLDSISQKAIEGFVYRSADIRNHSSVVQVIHENKKGEENEGVNLPHLIYVAREKRPMVGHHYKAGAMNVMARVSGIMTNAPYILNLDCDMHVSNPKAIQEAMCFFIGCPCERESGFVQFPQLFYGGLKDDPLGNQHKILMNTLGKGMNGIQGPIYFGTCCFHRRKGLYGVRPTTNKEKSQGKDSHHFSSFFSEESLRSTFGESSTLVASAQTIMRDTGFKIHSSPSLLEEEALKVASCTYETRTAWGKEVGWIYGTTVEDVMTGLKVHSLGWNSIYYVPEKPTFMGRTPVNSPDALVQLQRGGTGLLEIFISKSSPFLGMNRHIPLRQRMVYVYLVIWPTCSVPTLCYTILPAFSLLSGKSFLPKIQDPNFTVVVAMFLSLYGFKILEHILNGCSTREWLNNQRMWFIVSISSWIFSFFDVGMKIVGLSETVFVVTPKGSGDEEQVNEGDFTFGSSPLFIPPTTVLLINLAVIFYNIIGFVGGLHGIKDMQLAEFFCSVWVVFNLVPFLKGLVRKGKGGLPWNIVISSTALVLFVWSIIVRLGNFG